MRSRLSERNLSRVIHKNFFCLFANKFSGRLSIMVIIFILIENKEYIYSENQKRENSAKARHLSDSK